MTSDVSAMYAPEQVLSTSRELQAMHAGIDPSWSHSTRPVVATQIPTDSGGIQGTAATTSRLVRSATRSA